MADKGKITRRELIQAAAVVGAGGLFLGGATGYVAGGGGAQSGGAMRPGGAAGGNSADIRIVCVNPVTGAQANDAVHARNGAMLAIAEINALGGVLGRRLKYIEVDNANNTSEDNTTAWQRAVNVEKPDLIIGIGATAMGPDLDISAQAGVLYFNGNTREDWVKMYKTDPGKYWSVFQVDPTETMYGTGFALFLENLVKSGKYKPVAKTVALLAGDDPYDTWIAKMFEETASTLGWTITVKQTLTVNQVVDWGPLLARVRDKPPGIVFTTDFSPTDNAKMAKQWAANPLPCLLYQQYGPSVPEYLELAGDAANGIIWSTVLGLQVDAIGKEFRQKYQQKFNLQPSWAYAGALYDQVWLYAKAATLAGDVQDVRKIARVVEQTIHRGVTGGISFVNHTVPSYPGQTKDPSLGQPHIIVQIQNKQHKVIYPDPFTDSEFQIPPWIKA